ncbi:hypothetical protein Pmar_PMAR012982 [Perkinsus marinus ATCC 50983]|uniref:Uncharacterized protein n=1 Tax=Perkinsus marinus (strain ATCC 50983 / TXsc) TaxID=423536 RepID=C5KZC6_PERM5|nr:hypothetical protein Pmar_PMAR012982 [Perkinsus marinus ATCC 50983]EER10157.1 hypothetical protein Pmar_PMAR012982 [Perkinsus marinus ATCC 50983]|eukprot:XP_002778362.1 hypothetical protein Pmar_PMAR012982 [Perkinsus marinus ATCC 50983]
MQTRAAAGKTLQKPERYHQEQPEADPITKAKKVKLETKAKAKVKAKAKPTPKGKYFTCLSEFTSLRCYICKYKTA